MKDRLDKIKQNIQLASCGKHVEIVCATKMVSADIINQLPSFGLTVAGENKVQELCEKYPFVNGMKWRIIGQLQTNKVKYIIDKVEMIESVDRFSLADEIDKQAKKHGVKMQVLCQINAGEEESKGGVSCNEIEQLLSYVSQKENLILRGIMSVFPVGADESLYAKVKETFDKFKDKYNLTVLSMGMSADYEIAVKNGATEVRLGSALFGKRDYQKR